MIIGSKAIAFLCLFATVTLTTNAVMADGPRLRLFQKRSVESVQRPSTQNDHPARNVRGSGASSSVQSESRGSTSRLPSGRNYYQGQYYGNFNNRFYGPQYGYF